MKRKSKIMALVLSAVMAMSVCAATACTDDEQTTKPDDQTQTTPGGDEGTQKTPEVKSVSLKRDGKLVGETLEVSLKDGTLTLVAEVVKDDDADGKVTWTSSKQEVATVAEGVVTLKAAGETDIRAEAGNKSATVKLTVKPEEVTPPVKDPEVKSVNIKYDGEIIENTVTVYLEDETAAFEAVVTKDEDADGTVKWTSSNQTVATVSNLGTLTLKTTGETNLKAEAGDKSAEILVKVAEKPVDPKPDPKVTGVRIQRNNEDLTTQLTIGLTAESIELTPVVTAEEGAEYTLAWSSSVETVATVEGDNYKATVSLKGAGESTIKVVAAEEVFAQFQLVVEDDTAPKSYSITVNGGVAKNANGDTVTSATEGEQITLEATIPAHKTLEGWTVSEEVELNGTQFTMPASNVDASAQFEDILYPLTVVGGTVTKAGGVTNPQSESSSGDGLTVENTYKFAYDTQITIKALDAPSGKAFVAWDYLVKNNRIGEMGVEEYTFSMSDRDDAIYTSIYSAIKKDVWTSASAEKDMDGYTCAYYKKAHGAMPITDGGGDEDLQGLCGYALSVQASSKAVTGYDQNIRGSSYTTNENSRGMGKVIFKNHSATHTVKFDIYATESGIVSTSGVVEVGPNQVVEKNFSICFGLSNTWWGVALREDIGGDSSEWFRVDMVLGVVSQAYPTNDPAKGDDPLIETPGEWKERIEYKEGTQGSNWAAENAPKTSWQSGGVLFHCWGSWFGKGEDNTKRFLRYRINRSNSAFNDWWKGETTDIYGKITNFAVDASGDYDVTYKLVCSKNPDDPSGGFIKTINFTEYGQTVTFKFSLPHPESSEEYYFFIWKDVVENTQFGYAFLIQLMYTNAFNYQEA